jgi:hypothetical protein
LCVCGCRASFSPFSHLCEWKGKRVQNGFNKKFGYKSCSSKIVFGVLFCVSFQLQNQSEPFVYERERREKFTYKRYMSEGLLLGILVGRK